MLPAPVFALMSARFVCWSNALATSYVLGARWTSTSKGQWTLAMQVYVTPRRKGVFGFMAEEIALRVKEQRFYLTQAKARLLTPFAAIEAEAEAMEQDCGVPRI